MLLESFSLVKKWQSCNILMKNVNIWINEGMCQSFKAKTNFSNFTHTVFLSNLSHQRYRHFSKLQIHLKVTFFTHRWIQNYIEKYAVSSIVILDCNGKYNSHTNQWRRYHRFFADIWIVFFKEIIIFLLTWNCCLLYNNIAICIGF